MTRTITRTSIKVEHEGRTYEFPPTGVPAEWCDPLITERDGKLYVSYLAEDHEYRDWSENPLEENEGVAYRIFDNGRERDEWIDAHLDPDDLDTEVVEAINTGRFFWLERYEHGLVRYALVGESSMVDRQWDVAGGVGFLTLDEDWAGDLTEIARSLCAEFTDWCNGDIYGVVHATIDMTTGDVTDEDSCWGYIGSDHAEQTMKDEHPG